MIPTVARSASLVVMFLLLKAAPARAQGRDAPPWQYGAFADLGYSFDFNHPANHLFNDRGTTPHVDEVDFNMVGVYLRKEVSKESPFGMELTLHAGESSQTFGFSATAPNVSGADWLRYFGRANVSYLVPAGLTLQAGLFNSFIGYDSLYAQDNLNYTRCWGADYTPYLMFGLNASHPISDKLNAVIFVLNGYWHLANANHVPSSGGQLAYKPADHWSLKETLLAGPHQSDTSLEFWRFFSDSIAEWKRDPFTAAFEVQAGTERVALAGNPRATWMAVQLPGRWAVDEHWSLTVRPEIAWDSEGRWTGYAQTIKAITSTAEYRFAYGQTTTILRLEHRYDHSRGGGFYSGAEIAPGVVALTPAQHLLIFGAILMFDGRLQH